MLRGRAVSSRFCLTGLEVTAKKNPTRRNEGEVVSSEHDPELTLQSWGQVFHKCIPNWAPKYH